LLKRAYSREMLRRFVADPGRPFVEKIVGLLQRRIGTLGRNRARTDKRLRHSSEGTEEPEGPAHRVHPRGPSATQKRVARGKEVISDFFAHNPSGQFFPVVKNGKPVLKKNGEAEVRS